MAMSNPAMIKPTSIEQPIEISELRHFTLSLLKFFYQVCGRHVKMPYSLYKDLRDIEAYPCPKFTYQLGKALLILISEIRQKYKNPSNITNDDLNVLRQNLEENFNHRDFWVYITMHMLKLVYQKNNVVDQIFIMIKDVEDAFRYISSEKDLHDETKRIIDNYEKKRFVSTPEEKYMGKSGMEDEESFITRLVIQVFLLHLRLGPGYLLKKVILYRYIDPFSEDVKRAICLLLGHQSEHIKKIGFESYDMYYFNAVLHNFNARDFLEYSVLCSCKAVNDYFDGDNAAPAKTVDKLANVLELAKVAGLVQSLQIMDDAAYAIIQEYKVREEEERKYLNILTGASPQSPETNKYVPYRKLSNLTLKIHQSILEQDSTESAEQDSTKSAEQDSTKSAEQDSTKSAEQDSTTPAHE